MSKQNELRHLRKRIRQANIPKPTKNNFRLLTWNIRNFNQKKEDRAVTYYAQVIKNFDVIAIQEVKDNLLQKNKRSALLPLLPTSVFLL